MSKEMYNEKIIDDAVEILKDDGVIIVPTDTVYGLAISSNSPLAIKKVYEIKKRDLNKKLPLVVDTFDRLMKVCEIDKEMIKRIQPFYPGKVTIILKKKNEDETVAVRMINNEIINKIIERLDCPLLLTSANISGKEVNSDILELMEEFDGKVDMIIMGNKLGKKSSTIVDITSNDIKLVREGSVSFEEIKKMYYRG